MVFCRGDLVLEIYYSFLTLLGAYSSLDSDYSFLACFRLKVVFVAGPLATFFGCNYSFYSS